MPAGSKSATVTPMTRRIDSCQYADRWTASSIPSPVDVPEDEVEAGEDRDDVGDVHAPSTHGATEMLLNDAERIFTRNGPVSPLLTT